MILDRWNKKAKRGTFNSYHGDKLRHNNILNWKMSLKQNLDVYLFKFFLFNEKFMIDFAENSYYFMIK
jgi:hypothetical protein